MYIIYSFIFCFIFNLTLIAQNNINANGNKDGEWLGYHDNNSIKYKGHFIDGKESGFFTYYDYGGNIVIKLNYIDPGVLSTAILYYKNGIVKSKGQYLYKKKHGLWSYYNILGKKILVENYLNGRLDGESIYYSPSGIISESQMYSNGMKNGPSKIFYSSGNINMSGNYLDDKLHGVALFYFNNDTIQLESRGFYYYGLKDSTWVFYDERGKVVSIDRYSKGKFLNSE